MLEIKIFLLALFVQYQQAVDNTEICVDQETKDILSNAETTVGTFTDAVKQNINKSTVVIARDGCCHQTNKICVFYDACLSKKDEFLALLHIPNRGKVLYPFRSNGAYTYYEAFLQAGNPVISFIYNETTDTLGMLVYSYEGKIKHYESKQE